MTGIQPRTKPRNQSGSCSGPQPALCRDMRTPEIAQIRQMRCGRDGKGLEHQRVDKVMLREVRQVPVPGTQQGSRRPP